MLLDLLLTWTHTRLGFAAGLRNFLYLSASKTMVNDKYIGLALAVSGSLAIGTEFHHNQKGLFGFTLSTHLGLAFVFKDLTMQTN